MSVYIMHFILMLICCKHTRLIREIKFHNATGPVHRAVAWGFRMGGQEFQWRYKFFAWWPFSLGILQNSENSGGQGLPPAGYDPDTYVYIGKYSYLELAMFVDIKPLMFVCFFPNPGMIYNMLRNDLNI